jgi:hypothetical protein
VNVDRTNQIRPALGRYTVLSLRWFAHLVSPPHNKPNLVPAQITFYSCPQGDGLVARPALPTDVSDRHRP